MKKDEVLKKSIAIKEAERTFADLFFYFLPFSC
jgi:hypothetical protein